MMMMMNGIRMLFIQLPESRRLLDMLVVLTGSRVNFIASQCIAAYIRVFDFMSCGWWCSQWLKSEFYSQAIPYCINQHIIRQLAREYQIWKDLFLCYVSDVMSGGWWCSQWLKSEFHSQAIPYCIYQQLISQLAREYQIWKDLFQFYVSESPTALSSYVVFLSS